MEIDVVPRRPSSAAIKTYSRRRSDLPQKRKRQLQDHSTPGFDPGTSLETSLPRAEGQNRSVAHSSSAPEQPPDSGTEHYKKRRRKQDPVTLIEGQKESIDHQQTSLIEELKHPSQSSGLIRAEATPQDSTAVARDTRPQPRKSLEQPAAGKIKKVSIQNYFKPVPRPITPLAPLGSSSPTSRHSIHSDSHVPTSTPPSSPPSRSPSPDIGLKSLRKPRRRLTTKTHLPVITMNSGRIMHAESGEHSDDEDSDSTLNDPENIYEFIDKQNKLDEQEERGNSLKDVERAEDKPALTYDPVPSEPVPIPGKPVTHEEAAKNKWARLPHQKKYRQTTFSDLSMPAHEECKVCGLLYNKTSKEDRKKHKSYCGKNTGGAMPKVELSKILLSRWVDGTGVEHNILVVDRENSEQWKIYAEDALKISYRDLAGWEVESSQLWSEFDHATARDVPRYKIYLHTVSIKTGASTRTKIVGVVLAESIEQGAPYYHGKKNYSEQGPIPEIRADILVNFHEIQKYANIDLALPVFVSIDRIWTHANYRRRGIARQLVDTARETFVRGMPLSKRQLAFSLPTRDGYHFAADYCRSTTYDSMTTDGSIVPSSMSVALFLCNPADMPFWIEGGKVVENRGYRRRRGASVGTGF